MRYPITPVPKPRMTQSDRWKKRPPVMRYWEFVDKIKKHKVELPESGARITFYLPMPRSWSKVRKELWFNTPHFQKPDISNLLKALEDAVYDSDSQIWHYSEIKKLWADEGAIEIE